MKIVQMELIYKKNMVNWAGAIFLYIWLYNLTHEHFFSRRETTDGKVIKLPQMFLRWHPLNGFQIMLVNKEIWLP